MAATPFLHLCTLTANNQNNGIVNANHHHCHWTSQSNKDEMIPSRMFVRVMSSFCFFAVPCGADHIDLTADRLHGKSGARCA